MEPYTFSYGYKIFLSAIRLLWQSPYLLKWIIIPLILTIILDICILYVTFTFLNPWLYEWISSSIHYNATWLQWCIQLIVTVLVTISLMWTFLIFYLLIAGPFQENLSEAVEQKLGKHYDSSNNLKTLIQSVTHGIRQAIILGLAGFIVFIFGCIPLVGPIILIIGNAFILGYTFFEIPANRRLMTFRQKQQMIRPHFKALLGFGMPLAILSFFPLLQIIILPIAAVGGTILFLNIDRSTFHK